MRVRGPYTTLLSNLLAITALIALSAALPKEQHQEAHEVTSLSLRDPGELLDRRWSWAWASSVFYWKTLGVSTTVFSTACSMYSLFVDVPSVTGLRACAVGSAIGVLASFGALMAEYAGASLVTVLSGFGMAAWSLISFLKEKRDIPTIDELPYQFTANLTSEQRDHLAKYIRLANKHRFHHAGGDHGLVGWDAMQGANKTHPLELYLTGSHVATPGNVTVWSEPHPIHTNRSISMVKMPIHMVYGASKPEHAARAEPRGQVQQCDEVERQHGIEFCAEPGSLSSEYPDDMYAGIDIYGAKNLVVEWDEDMGDYVGKKDKRYDYAESNGFYKLAEALADELTNYGSYGATPWEGCICMQTQGQWIATGSLQYTWNHGAYNGYGACWNANCDGA